MAGGAGALATVDDVAAVWRPLDADEEAQADGLLGKASSLVRSQVPGIDERVAASEVFADVVAGVVAAVVVRVLVNPDNVQQRTTGPFSETRLVQAERLYLTAGELALLRPPAVLAGVYSVSLS